MTICLICLKEKIDFVHNGIEMCADCLNIVLDVEKNHPDCKPED
mgnify:CR=1 FL=1|jgi:hypothetical protein